jgi:predicted pyridoxine 5'-phosphate oxidase superfamily flavin-nucleotide-binding protein
MAVSRLYHAGNRDLQGEFGTIGLADRMETVITRTEFTASDQEFIEQAIYFFLATATADGQPDCSFKGGPAGFVRVTGPGELAFPDYDGNGMFKSLGNLRANPSVGLLFINMHGAPRRLRVNGQARVLCDDPLLATTLGAQLIVRVAVRVIFPNCPRYVPTMSLTAPSEYTPQAGCPAIEPEWKKSNNFKSFMPGRRTQ